MLLQHLRNLARRLSMIHGKYHGSIICKGIQLSPRKSFSLSPKRTNFWCYQVIFLGCKKWDLGSIEVLVICVVSTAISELPRNFFWSKYAHKHLGKPETKVLTSKKSHGIPCHTEVSYLTKIHEIQTSEFRIVHFNHVFSLKHQVSLDFDWQTAQTSAPIFTASKS